jgi:hypothetical protein
MKIAKILPILARVAMGGLFVFSGSNKLVPFLTMPPMSPAAMAFLGALAATGYMVPLIGAIEVVFGGLLIAGRFVPLALTMLAPLVVNIALFHTLIEPGLPVVVLLLVCELSLAWVYRDAFRGLFQATTPRTADEPRASAVGRTSLAS